MLFPAGHFVFLDLETTGTRASADRIIEVALIEVLDGEVIDHFETLVNPGLPLPPFITGLTGIDDAMLATAPGFAEVAEDLLGRLLGRVLVAHNARFDHSFLKNEFRRQGLDYRTPVLCSLKLSRRLAPAERGHGLDRLVARYGLEVEARHRAMGDADLLVQLLARWSRLLGTEQVEAQIREQLSGPALPAQLDPEAVAAIPNEAGVYLFYDARDTLLYVGKSVRIRERVKSHFSADHASDRELELCRQTSRVEHYLTGGDLGAQLLEARLIKERGPVYNRQLRKTRRLWYLAFAEDSRGYLTVNVKSGAELPADRIDRIAGLFRSRRMAEEVLRRVADEHGLCHRLTGLEKSRRGACFAHQLRRCAGACAGKEEVAEYNRRLQAAFDQWRFRVWPYAGAVVIEESGGHFHLVDQWCWLGSAQTLAGLQHTESSQRLEYDIYKILLKFICRDVPGIRVIPLAEAAAPAVSAR